MTVFALFCSVAFGQQVNPNKLPPCPNLAKVWNNCFGTFTWERGKYIGEFQNDKREGYGVLFAEKEG